MSRRRLVPALALVAAVLAAVPSALGATQAAAPRFTADPSAKFPDRIYRVALPERRAITTDDVTVTENGGPVDSLAVKAPGVEDTGTVLLLDTSLTMRGQPIEDAMKAARAFAARRTPNQRLAVVTFNGEVSVLLPFTTNQAEIDAALSTTPKTAYGTVIYDALTTAADLIEQSGLPGGSVVLLADGQNVGSKLTLGDAVSRLKETGTRAFTVGLRSRAFNASTLERIASSTGGTYAEATSSSQLAGIFNAIGFKLANEYAVRWRSLQGPDVPVNVSIAVAGYPKPFTTTYTTPALTIVTPHAPDLTVLDRIVQSRLAMLLVAIGAAVLLGYAVVAILRRPDDQLRRRLGEYVSIQPPDEARQRREELQQLVAMRPDRRAAAEHRRLAGLENDLELADVPLSPPAFLVGAGGLTLLVAVLLGALTTSVWAALLGLVATPFIVRALLRSRIARRRRIFGEQLPDNLDVLASALRAGHSLVGAMAVMVEDASEPSKSEFRRVLADEQLGVPLDEALSVTVLRMDSRDLDQVAIVAALQRETGGNSAEVLDRVAENIRDRMELRRLIRVLTAQGRLARWIISLLPVAIFVGIYIIRPEYLDPLWTTAIGRVLVVVAGLMVMSGFLVIKRIVDIKV